jgi:hypothetical protein
VYILCLNCELVLRRFPSLGYAGRTPVTMYQDGIYVSVELWQYWREAFPRCSVCDMFVFVKYDIDDERAKFTRSLA